MARSNDWLEKQWALAQEEINALKDDRAELRQQNIRLAKEVCQLKQMIGRPTIWNLIKLIWKGYL